MRHVRILLIALLPAVAVVGLAVLMWGCGSPGRPEPSRFGPDASGPGDAGLTTWRRSRITPNSSHLKIGDTEELPLKGMQASVRVDGFRARVVLDCYFYNDRDRPLEGTFQFRLPNGASPYFLAFGATSYRRPDVPVDGPVFFPSEQARRLGSDPEAIMADRLKTWSQPHEARMVPRTKAAFAYGETTRRRVDPALMEWAGAGVFNARVYPLEPRRLHRIVVGYDVDLLAVGEDLEYRLDLPENLDNVVVDLNVAHIAGVDPIVRPEAGGVSSGAAEHYRFENPEARTITVRLTRPGPLLLSGNDVETGPYFAARFRPDLPVASAGGDEPSHAVFLVDISLSSNPDRFNIWRDLMREILTNNRQTVRDFRVLFFNVESFWWRPTAVANTPENVRSLMAFADTLVLEGATDLGAALAKAALGGAEVAKAPAAHRSRPWQIEPVDIFLLSDGAATWGQSNPQAAKAALGGARLFAYETGLAGTDGQVLDMLARESGGAVFSVVGEAEVAKASVAHRSRPWRIESVQVSGGKAVLLAGRPRAIFPGQDLLLAGRGSPEANAPVVLRVRRAAESKTVTVPLRPAIRSALAPRVYGQLAVTQLEEFGLDPEQVTKAYATHFRVTGKTCSLLMLESDADYERFDIRPDDDARVVKTARPETVIAQAARQAEDRLGDPKGAFLAWLEKMARTPGVRFRVPEDLRAALEAMPREAFRVDVPPLECTLRRQNDMPRGLLEHLSAGKLDYDVIAAEASRRMRISAPADALKTLSSLVEQHPGDGVVARDVGFSAMEWGMAGQAYHLFARVAAARPYEPQTYLAMARCLETIGRTDLAMAYFEVGLSGTWDARFGDFGSILELEYLRFLRRIERGELVTSVPAHAAGRLRAISRRYDIDGADMVVVITWNTDQTDVDLHVTEPAGEVCYYSHPRTRIGGSLTRDVRSGYGPEMYVLRQAPAGRFDVKVKYFASDLNRLGVRTKVYATIYEGWGTRGQKVTRKAVTLTKGSEMQDVATVRISRRR